MLFPSYVQHFGALAMPVDRLEIYDGKVFCFKGAFGIGRWAHFNVKLHFLLAYSVIMIRSIKIWVKPC